MASSIVSTCGGARHFAILWSAVRNESQRADANRKLGSLRSLMTRIRLIIFIAIFQSFLWLIHFFLYETWTFSPVGNDAPGALWMKVVVGFLSVSFIGA